MTSRRRGDIDLNAFLRTFVGALYARRTQVKHTAEAGLGQGCRGLRKRWSPSNEAPHPRWAPIQDGNGSPPARKSRPQPGAMLPVRLSPPIPHDSMQTPARRFYLLLSPYNIVPFLSKACFALPLSQHQQIFACTTAVQNVWPG